MDKLSIYGLTIFFNSMYKVIEINYKTKKDSWLTCDLSFLTDKLKEEVAEYFTAPTDIERMNELIDIANICLFLFIRCMLTSSEYCFSKHLKKIKAV